MTALWVLYSCGKMETEPIHVIEGYIVAYDQCTYAFQVNGFYIVSTNLKDTILTYNLPDSLFNIPRSYFQKYKETPYFADSLRYKFKLRATYALTQENELIYPPCLGIISLSIRVIDFANPMQVTIKSAIKLETKK